MHHIFVNENNIDLRNRIVGITKNADYEVFNHLVNSLRINKGEQILCSVVPFASSFDYLCEVSNVDSENVVLAIKEEMKSRELPVTINLYQGISKADKLEFIIEKAVELGVSSITPLSSEYCIAKIDEKKSDKKIDRFNKIAKSAAEQSKRHIIPKVNEPLKYADMLEQISDIQSKKVYNILFYENADGIMGTKKVIQEIKQDLLDKSDIGVNVIIGPEGGFSEKEIDMAKQRGLSILSLGDRILRTETAAVTALSILMYELS